MCFLLSAVHFRDYRHIVMLDSYMRQRRSRNSRTIVAFAFNLNYTLLTSDISVPRTTNPRGNTDSPLSAVTRLPSLCSLGALRLECTVSTSAKHVVSILLSQHSPLASCPSLFDVRVPRVTSIRFSLKEHPVSLLVRIRDEDTSILVY